MLTGFGEMSFTEMKLCRRDLCTGNAVTTTSLGVGSPDGSAAVAAGTVVWDELEGRALAVCAAVAVESTSETAAATPIRRGCRVASDTAAWVDLKYFRGL